MCIRYRGHNRVATLELVNTPVFLLGDWSSVSITFVGMVELMVAFRPVMVLYFSVSMNRLTL